jgi:hypothetical protein
MKITLKLGSYYLKKKYCSSTIELNYTEPVPIHKVLKDAKISLGETLIIRVGDSIVNESYVLVKSEEINLIPVSVGG